MKTFTTGRLALAAALLSKGCRVALPPYAIRRNHDGSVMLDFNLEDAGDVESLKSDALAGTLQVPWLEYENKRAMLLEFTKREAKR